MPDNVSLFARLAALDAENAELRDQLAFRDSMRKLRKRVLCMNASPVQKLLMLKLNLASEESETLTLEYRRADMANELCVSERSLTSCHTNLAGRGLFEVNHQGQNAKRRVTLLTDTGAIR